MLCFLPPGPGAPRPERPNESARSTGSGRSIAGIVVAVVLTVAGMLLPWLRPDAHPLGAHLPRGAFAKRCVR